MAIINKQTSKEPSIMTLLRKLVLTCLRFNILFVARHVAGRDNTLADKLSRLQITEFHRLASWCQNCPTTVPNSISPEGFGKL